jgi:hypothetical protein
MGGSEGIRSYVEKQVIKKKRKIIEMKSGNEMEKNPKIRIGHLSTLLQDPGGPCCGVETVIANLIKEQVDQQGHKVTLFASGTAKTKANLVSIYPNSLASTSE